MSSLVHCNLLHTLQFLDNFLVIKLTQCQRITHKRIVPFFVEPITSTKPKFPMTENSRTFTTYTVQREQHLTLSCPAQAFPVPSYRYIKYIQAVFEYV